MPRAIRRSLPVNPRARRPLVGDRSVESGGPESFLTDQPDAFRCSSMFPIRSTVATLRPHARLSSWPLVMSACDDGPHVARRAQAVRRCLAGLRCPVLIGRHRSASWSGPSCTRRRNAFIELVLLWFGPAVPKWSVT